MTWKRAMPTKKFIADVLPDLPKEIVTGDRIKLRDDPELRQAFVSDCRKAGWNVDPNAIRVVTSQDKWNPGGGRRLFVEGPPFAYSSTMVCLAWNSENARREFLRGKGWKV